MTAQGVVVITGASTGIGKACALRLDRLGFRVFAGVRKAEDGENLKRQLSERLTPITIEVTDSGSIAAAAEKVASAVGDVGLSGLVNNAGIAVAWPLEFVPVAELRKQLEVNVIGQVAVTQAFLPLLGKGNGRIVNMGSISGRMAFPLLGPYCISKFALEAFTASLRMELRPWGIPVSIIEPGAIATPIWSKAIASGDEYARLLPPEAVDLYGPVVATQRKRVVRNDRSGVTPDAVARAVSHALTAKRARTRYVVGRRAWLGELLRILPERLREGLITWQVAR